LRRVALVAVAVIISAGIAVESPHLVRHLGTALVARHRSVAVAHRAAGVVTGTPAVAAPGSGAQSPPATATPLLSPHPVTVDDTVFFGWSLLDRKTGAIAGSVNRETGTNSTESMIKAWIASDYLRQMDAAGRRPTAAALHDLTLMIIDSNDNMAQKYYLIDGKNAVVARLISMCGLRHTTIYNAWWSKTRMTPADTVRYGRCVADGRAAGKRWTPWVLDTMRHVRGGINDQQRTTGGGHWGIITALPPVVAATTSIKNGWTAYEGVWHVNCMAIQKDWVLSVMMRYSAGKNLAFGANVCSSVTRQLMNSLDPSRGPSSPAVA
jgi:hypothetical protein